MCRNRRLKASVSVRLQGLGLIGIALLCHWTNADGAALFMGCLGALILMVKITRGDATEK